MSDVKFPFIGIISRDGYLEVYDEKHSRENQNRHYQCLSSEGRKYYERDDTLRFILGGWNGSSYLLLGEPALDPFNTGRHQIEAFATHAIQQGASPQTKVVVGNHHLGTKYEGKIIGRLEMFLKTP